MDKQMWYIYTTENQSALKKNEIMPFAAIWMDLKIIILNEVRQQEKDKYHIISLTIQSKKVQMNLSTKQKQSHKCRKQTYSFQGVEGGGKNWEAGMDIYTLYI